MILLTNIFINILFFEIHFRPEKHPLFLITLTNMCKNYETNKQRIFLTLFNFPTFFKNNKFSDYIGKIGNKQFIKSNDKITNFHDIQISI